MKSLKIILPVFLAMVVIFSVGNVYSENKEADIDGQRRILG